MQKEENQRDGEKRRELSEITQKHLERVINTMILSSGGSSLHSVENAPMNSMISQLTEKSIEGDRMQAKQGETGDSVQLLH